MFGWLKRRLKCRLVDFLDLELEAEEETKDYVRYRRLALRLMELDYKRAKLELDRELEFRKLEKRLRKPSYIL